MWFHCSRDLIPDDDLVTSPDARGTAPISFGDRWQEAKALGICRTDRVFIYRHDNDDAARHIGMALWARPDRYYYEVEPLGPLEEDPSGFDENYRCCVQARVIRCIHWPEDS